MDGTKVGTGGFVVGLSPGFVEQLTTPETQGVSFKIKNMAPVLTVLVIVASASYVIVNAQDSDSCKISCIGQTCDTIVAKSSLNNPTDCAKLEKTCVWC